MASEASSAKSRHSTLRFPLRSSGDRCGFCRRSYDRFGRCLRRNCPGYMHIWLRDQHERLTVNLTAFREGSGNVMLATVTAPGAKALPWDRRRCAPGQHDCGGERGCRVQVEDAHSFNLTAPSRFAVMHRTASRRAGRAAGCEFFLLARVWEVQLRGVLHVHPIIACGTGRQRNGAAAYIEAVDALAHKHGYGFTDRRPREMLAERAAGYCVKELAETVQMSASPKRVVWISERLTKATGCTTRALRERRYRYACQQTTPDRARP